MSIGIATIRHRLTVILCMTACCAIIGTAKAAGPDKATEPVDRITGHDRVFHSAVLEQDRPISVLLPFGYQASVRRYPVLFVLDGGAYDAYAAATAELLAFQREIPPLIVVGIASIDRTYDLTPHPLPDIPGSGGGPDFLEFIETELAPFIDEQYRTDGLRILFGHSLGGSFAVHSLFAAPSLFRAVLAISPALYSDRGRMLRSFEAELKTGRTFPTDYLYMAVGNEIAYPESLEFLTGLLEQFPPAGLRWESHTYPEEGHGSIVLRTLAPSLKALFETWPITIDDIGKGYEAVARHYETVSEALGHYVPIPEDLVNRLGYRALAEEDYTRAEMIFMYNVRTYPGSANVHDSLGEAFHLKGDGERAIESYRKSLELDPGNENAVMMIDKILSPE